jgi:hypothetical protein
MATTFYSTLREDRKDDDELAACIDRVVVQLEDTSTDSQRPGMLLGKIQSGKTRAFVGVIASAFDHGFDIAVVLTKGTKTLAAQTVARLTTDYREFIDDDELLVFDIMTPPGRLTKSELNRKIVVVAKKQAANLRKLLHFFETEQPHLKSRKVLLIDDEADLASVRFVKKRGRADVEQGTIAGQMDELRGLVSDLAFLQVTATPYSLYLQPEDYTESAYVFKPKKPAFTELLPIHAGYVGGDDYFGAHGSDDPRYYLVVDVDTQEQDALRKADQRRIKAANVLTSPLARGLVRSVVTFILAACIRRWQQADTGEKKRKYAMVIHNDTKKSAHAWQYTVVEWILSASRATDGRSEVLTSLFEDALRDLSKSITANHGRVPPRDTIFDIFVEALEGDNVVLEPVNSDKDVMALLDDKAELKLRTPYNIFVGGNILDRGITIPNLISFYYGRSPNTMQADTVLQHSRIYGNRDRRDLAITRFYTSRDVYNRLYSINSFENALRQAFEDGTHDQGVVFIQSDAAHRIRPCAPSKVLLSNVVAVRPNGLYLPTNFETLSGSVMTNATKLLDSLIPAESLNASLFTAITREKALAIISAIEITMVFSNNEFEWDAMRGLIEYYSDTRNGDGSVLLVSATDRRLDKEASGDKSGLSILGGGGTLRSLVLDPNRIKPALVLLKQIGTKELHWSGHPFWWPILAMPAIGEPCVFATKVAPD